MKNRSNIRNLTFGVKTKPNIRNLTFSVKTRSNIRNLTFGVKTRPNIRNLTLTTLLKLKQCTRVHFQVILKTIGT